MCKFIVVCLVAKDFFPFWRLSLCCWKFCFIFSLSVSTIVSWAVGILFKSSCLCLYLWVLLFFSIYLLVCVYVCPVSMCGQRTSCRSRFSHLVVWRIKLRLKHGSKHPFLLSLSPAPSLSFRVSGVTLRFESIL